MEKITVGTMETYYVSDRRLWLTADRTEVVEEGDPRAAELWVAEGGRIREADAKRFKLDVKSRMPAEDKSSAPQEDKSGGSEGYPLHTGGGWYELSNGERVRGKDAAEEAEANL